MTKRKNKTIYAISVDVVLPTAFEIVLEGNDGIAPMDPIVAERNAARFQFPQGNVHTVTPLISPDKSVKYGTNRFVSKHGIF